MERIRWYAWRLRLRVSEFIRYRLIGRTVGAVKRRVGVPLVRWGTDCDGMRWASCSWFWTRSAALAAFDDAAEWADGPMSGEVVTASEGRQWEREYVPDTRDRFAERMGY